MKLKLLALFVLAAVIAAAPAYAFPPAHGPKHGYLIISGGADYHLDIPRLIAMAGGLEKARIVVIPTASVTRPETAAQLASYCTDPKTFAGTHCTVLHTTDRAVANS